MVYVWHRLVTLCLPDFTLPLESWWKSALSIWSWQSSWKLVSYDVPRWLNLRIVFRTPTELGSDRKHRIESFGDLVSDTQLHASTNGVWPPDTFQSVKLAILCYSAILFPSVQLLYVVANMPEIVNHKIIAPFCLCHTYKSKARCQERLTTKPKQLSYIFGRQRFQRLFGGSRVWTSVSRCFSHVSVSIMV